MNAKNDPSGLDSIFRSIFNSLPGNAVVIDSEGLIIATNANWNKFAMKHGSDANNNWIGQNCPEVCKQLTGISDVVSDEAWLGIKAILSGEESGFELAFSGQKSGEKRWFKIQASGFQFEGAFFATIIHEDITEISELDFNLLVNSSPGVIYKCCLDDPWEMHFISDRIEILSGYPKEDFLGLNPIRPFGEIMHPDDREEASRLVQIAIDKKESYKLAYRVIDKDRHINYVFGYGQAAYKSDGSPDYLVGVIFNDTDRVVALNKVKESEERFRATFEQAAVGIAHVSPNGSFLRINQKFCDIVGYSQKEMLELTFQDITHPDDLELDIGNVNNLLQDELETYSLAKRYFHKNGSIIWVNLTVSLVQTSAAKPDYFVSVIEEITARIEAEKKVQESEENYRTLIEQANDGIVVIQDAKVKFANSALTRITGYSVEELTGSNFIDFIDEKELDKVKAKYEKRMNGEHIADYESRIVHKNGSVIDVEFNGRLTQYKGQVADLAMIRDISERKKAEVERNRIFNLSSDLICIVDFNGVLKQTNPAWKKVIGYQEEELVGESVLDFIHSEDIEKSQNEIGKLSLGAETINFENRYKHKDGSIKYISWKASPLVEEQTIYSIGRDVTESKLAELAIIESEEKYRNLIEHLKDGVVLIQDDVVKFTNQTMCDLTGYTADEFIGKGFIDFISLDELSDVLDKYNKRDLNSTWEPYEISLVLKNGNNLDFEITATQSTFQRQDAILVLARDISERKKVEEALAENEKKFRLLVEQSPLPILIFNPDGFLDEVNLSWQKMWGLSDEELQQVLAHYNILKDEMSIKYGHMPLILKAFSGEPVVLPLVEFDGKETMDRFGKKIDARKLWILISYYPIKNKNGEVVKVVGLVEDFSERKLWEQETLNYQQQLKDLALELTYAEEKQRKQIATDLHDDVGQLLASARLQIAAVKPGMDKNEILEKMKDISQGLLEAIQATRSAIFELSPPQLNEIGLVAAISDWMEEEVEAKHGIKTSLLGKDQIYDLSEQVRYLLFRCVRELLLNVIKHSKATQVSLNIYEENDALYIVVQDDGIGFDHLSGNMGVKHIGFGLFSILERIKNIGGSMEVDSRLGEGTIITLNLPLN